MNLFGEIEENDESWENSGNAGNCRRGSAGHNLTLADLKIRGFNAAELEGIHTDIVAEIYGKMKRFQVKSSQESGRFGSVERPLEKRGVRGGARSLLSYIDEIDAFAFVMLPRRAVYYVAIEAIASNSLVLNSWSRQACDLSFVELLRRWKLEQSQHTVIQLVR